MSTNRTTSALLLTLWLILAVMTANGQTISGTTTVCNGNNTTLSGSPAGGTWSSSDVTMATVSTFGIATGVSSGVATITYNTGSGYATATLTINPVPAAISGSLSLCVGSTPTLTDTTPGGTWSSSTTVIVTVGSSSGIMTGLMAGTSTISYSLPTGCSTTAMVTVNPTPAAISGSNTVCAGSTTSLTNLTPGGTWNSSNAAVASIGPTGAMTGNSPGVATISYTLATGCRSTIVATVLSTPSIIGSSTICNGSTMTLSGSVGGGTWTSANTSIASFSAPTSGVLTGNSAGYVTITYMLPSGCSAIRIDTILVTPANITGPSTMCVGATTTLGNSIGGGIWTSAPSFVAAIGATTGIISGMSAGTATITYTLSNGCSKTSSETVSPTPAAITGSTIICTGANTTLSNTSPGGTWTSSSSAVATVGVTTGIVSGISAGTANITYTAGACFTTATTTVVVAPSAGSISPVSMCLGTTTTISSTATGGTWSSSNPSIATIGATTGIVTAVAAGAATLTYAVSNSCGTAIATTAVTVGALPTITGTSPTCIGLSSTLSTTSGCGTWSSGSSSVATVTPITTSTAVVTGIAAGIATISFTSCTGCVSTLVVTISATPPPIMGSSAVCLSSTIVLDDSVTGGTWHSSNPSVATISTVGISPGTVTGVSTGTAIITYALAAGCTITTTITVNPLPVITASAVSISCGGVNVVTASGGATYSWLPTTGVSCSTCATTNINASGAAIYTVTGTSPLGCSNSATVSLSGNRIYGHISFSGATPSATDVKVWLIQYNPLDSSIIAVDSTLTCMDSTLPYYQFNGKPAGEYLVKTKLLSSIPGTSDYIPTYGSSSAHWYMANPIVHTSAADSQHISMMYGTVLSGAGFISGYIYAGAGKGTATAAPVTGMLVYLKNVVTGVILNYTYTDATGKYTFTNLPFGNYFVYPEEYGYYTTPSSILTVGPSTESVVASFKKHTDYGTITPDNLSWVSVAAINQGTFNIYPNPSTGILNINLPQYAASAEVIVTDATGRVMYQQKYNTVINNALSLQLQNLQTGLYILSINTGNDRFSQKFTLQ